MAVSQWGLAEFVQFVSDTQHVGPGLGHAAGPVLDDELLEELVFVVLLLVDALVPPSPVVLACVVLALALVVVPELPVAAELEPLVPWPVVCPLL